MTAAYAEEATRAGNQQYKKGCFEEALRLYDCALVVCSGNAACRGNRAAALTALRRFDEAVKECEDALRIDPSYGRAHKRLASLHIRAYEAVVGEYVAWLSMLVHGRQPSSMFYELEYLLGILVELDSSYY